MESLQLRLILKESGFVEITGAGKAAPCRQINVSPSLFRMTRFPLNVPVVVGAKCMMTIAESKGGIEMLPGILVVYSGKEGVMPEI